MTPTVFLLAAGVILACWSVLLIGAASQDPAPSQNSDYQSLKWTIPASLVLIIMGIINFFVGG